MNSEKTNKPSATNTTSGQDAITPRVLTAEELDRTIGGIGGEAPGNMAMSAVVDAG